MKNNIIMAISFAVPLAIGIFAGHYHGKAVTLERFVSPEIECKLGINPVTMGMVE